MLCAHKSNYKDQIEMGTRKLKKELDIKRLVKTNRFVKILKRGVLNKEQQILLNLSKSQYLEYSEESSTD